MKYLPILLIVFGLSIIIFKELLNLLVGGFFLFLGFNLLLLTGFFKNFGKKTTENKKDEPIMNFGKYKIYKK